MSEFEKSLADLQRDLYGEELIPEALSREEQNSEYGGGRFRIEQRTIRYRVAKITPKKVGQFVAFWHKVAGKNTPYTVAESPELLVVTTYCQARSGQFVFPKEELAKRGILSQGQNKGKMAIRVYPSWDHPTSAQARRTQVWQLPFFIEFGQGQRVDQAKLRQLYLLEEAQFSE